MRAFYLAGFPRLSSGIEASGRFIEVRERIVILLAIELTILIELEAFDGRKDNVLHKGTIGLLAVFSSSEGTALP